MHHARSVFTILFLVGSLAGNTITNLLLDPVEKAAIEDKNPSSCV